MVTLEDGFLKSYAPGPAEPGQSYIVDRLGVYFEPLQPNDLQNRIRSAGPGAFELERARALIGFIRENRLSKYNNAPIRPLSETGLPIGRPYVLLVDQVPGDASIRGAGADNGRFADMLMHARDHYPQAVIAVRAHPAAGDNSLLLAAARALKIDVVQTSRANPWPMIENADAVYTVSSQLGFEALMAETRVHAFGATYYSHLGLTEDHADVQRPVGSASLEHVFHAAFVGYSRYLDLHDRGPVEIERTLDQLLTVRNQRNQIARPVYTGGLSPWKRRAMDPFLKGPSGAAVHCASLEKAVTLAQEKGGQLAVWGSARSLPADVPALRFEDGFIRSRGLGANLSLPCSLAMDCEHVYYDARGESRLEHLIATHAFPEDLLARSRGLIDLVVARGVSKYNLDTEVDLPSVAPGRLKILVPGQVEKDASIRFGSPALRSNAALVAAVRALFADAFIVYKEHPDVTSGLRSGGETPTAADLVVRSGDIKHWIYWCDRVETMTSLAGFEALIRDKPVGVHGLPFYAGWGLTDDRLPAPRRNRRITVEMLAAATLILYPFYIHPLSAMPCSPEELVEEIALNRQVLISRFSRLKNRIAQSINRTAVKIRDGRN